MVIVLLSSLVPGRVEIVVARAGNTLEWQRHWRVSREMNRGFLHEISSCAIKLSAPDQNLRSGHIKIRIGFARDIEQGSVSTLSQKARVFRMTRVRRMQYTDPSLEVHRSVCIARLRRSVP